MNSNIDQAGRWGGVKGVKPQMLEDRGASAESVWSQRVGLDITEAWSCLTWSFNMFLPGFVALQCNSF